MFIAAMAISILLIAVEVALLVVVQAAAVRERVEERNRQIAVNGFASVKAKREPALQSRIDRAGIEMSSGFYTAAVAAAGAILALALASRFGVPGALAGAVIAVAASEVLLRTRAKSRMGDFEKQLGQALPMIAEGVRTGMTFEQSMGNVAATMQEPFKSQVETFTAERSYGVPLEAALENFAKRIDSRDMNDLTTVVLVQSETGGRMADILDSIAATIQRREKIRAHKAAVTADGRLSAGIIAAIPAFLLATLSLIAPDYMSLLYTTPVGIAMLFVSAVMVAIGLLIIRKLYNIKIY